jgi:predicted GH43/DUF377 family glycosyl hydrolase
MTRIPNLNFNIMLLGILVTLCGSFSAHTQDVPLEFNELRNFTEKGKWTPYPGNPVLKPGEEGEWDSWTLATANVLKVRDTCHLYYEAGSKGVIDFQIGHATSTDGVHWVKDPANPVIPVGENGDWDDMETWDAFVLFEDELFKMWYGGTTLINDKRDFQIGYATSRDGTHFTKYGKISNYPRGNVGDMHVVHDEQSGKYYMYFIDRNVKGFNMFRAESTHETGFNFSNAEPVSVVNEEVGYRCPHVFIDNGKWYMYYGFKRKSRAGYSCSEDGLHWKAINTSVFEGDDAEILKMADKLYLMYFCPPEYELGHKPGCDIRVAVYKGSLDGL